MTTTFHSQAVRLYGTFSTLDKISPVTRQHDSSSRSSANVDNTLESCFCDSETSITQVVRRHTDLHQIVIISSKGKNCDNSAARLSLTPYLATIYQENVKMTIFLSTQVQQPEPYKSHHLNPSITAIHTRDSIIIPHSPSIPIIPLVYNSLDAQQNNHSSDKHKTHHTNSGKRYKFHVFVYSVAYASIIHRYQQSVHGACLIMAVTALLWNETFPIEGRRRDSG